MDHNTNSQSSDENNTEENVSIQTGAYLSKRKKILILIIFSLIIIIVTLTLLTLFVFIKKETIITNATTEITATNETPTIKTTTTIITTTAPVTTTTIITTTTMITTTAPVTTTLVISTTSTPPCISTFASQTTYTAGDYPNSVTTADVNDDNIPDIIVSNYNSNNVGVLLNNGTGIFNDQVTYSTGAGSGPQCVTTADVNGDNIPDIIVSNYNSNNVGVVLNSGAGTFNDQVTYPTGWSSSPNSVTTADVNGDNKPDIIVTNSGEANIGVFLNNGTGTFDDQVTYSTGSGSDPDFVTTADVNGDNRPDIIVTMFHDAKVGVLLNNGTGTFNDPVTYSTGSGSGPRSVTTADVNGDNEPDIIVPNYNSNNVGILLNNGTGIFNDQVTYFIGSGSGPHCVTTADVNGDNKPDIIVANYDGNNVVVLLNNGVGIFNDQMTYPAGSGPDFVTTADVNGDNKPDIMVTNTGDSNVGVFLSYCVSRQT